MNVSNAIIAHELQYVLAVIESVSIRSRPRALNRPVQNRVRLKTAPI